MVLHFCLDCVSLPFSPFNVVDVLQKTSRSLRYQSLDEEEGWGRGEGEGEGLGGIGR